MSSIHRHTKPFGWTICGLGDIYVLSRASVLQFKKDLEKGTSSFFFFTYLIAKPVLTPQNM